MNREEALATELLEIAKGTKQIGFESMFRGDRDQFGTGEMCYEVDPKVQEKYRRLPLELLEHSKSAKRFSLRTTATMVNESIARLMGGHPTVAAAQFELRGILATLSAIQPERTLLYELPGIDLPVRARPYAIAGARVARFSTRAYKLLARQCRAGLSTDSRRKRDQDYRTAYKPHLDRLKGKTTVLCTYAAEPTRAQELSLEALHWVTVVLEYACMALRRDSAEMAIGIGYIARLEYLNIPDQGGFVMSGAQVKGKYRSWLLRSSDRTRMREAGVFALSDILEKSDNGRALAPRSFQAALLQALQWAVTSLDQMTNDSKMLALTVALESLFSSYTPHPASAVAEGTAMVISRDLAERQSISKQVKDLYDKRSDIAHGRGETNISSSDVLEMEYLVTSVISVLCRHEAEYGTLKDFSQALSLAKLSGQVFKG
jgi:hypothetical protein